MLPLNFAHLLSSYTRWLLVAGLLLTLGAGGILWYLSTQMQKHQLINAQEDAQTFAHSVAEFRNFYTQEIVPRARESGMQVSPHYLEKEGALPLPATFILDFGEFISARDRGLDVNLYSDLPFPERADRQLDAFQKEALAALEADKTEAFARVERLDGVRTLRLAVPDIMESACVACHNSYPGSPKTDWELGDVRGAIEVRRRLDESIPGLHSGLINAALLSGFLILSLLAVMWLAMNRMGKAHRQLTRSNAKLATTQQQLNQQIFALNQHAIVSVTNDKGEIIDANDKFCEVSGYSRDELLGKNHRLVNSGYHSQEFFQDLWNTITSGQVWSGEIRNQAKDGSYYWVSATLVPFLDASGQPYQYIGIRTDITQRKAFEMEAIQAKEAAEAASQAKSEFLANMSHEIRTPMNGIIGMTHLALTTPSPQEQQEYLEIVQDSAESLLTILNDILDFSKIEAKKLELEQVTFNLPTLLEKIHKALLQRAEEKGLQLILQQEVPAPGWLKGDPTRLRQILVNLVGNAIKFTSQGQVVIRVSLLQQRQNQVELNFAVTDTGVGISETQLQAIFDAFSQADASTTREFGGTGLGLAISSQLVELMEGKIQVSSRLGEGSCFEFCLPFTLAEPPEQRVEPEAKASIKASLKVLLVEDNPVNRKLASALLTKLGCQVDEAVNGAEGVAAYTARATTPEAYDLVVMDLQMPVMGGLEATRQLRDYEQQQGLSQVAILAMTANAMKSDREACLEAGMTDYLSKPLRADELKNKLAAILKNSDAH